MNRRSERKTPSTRSKWLADDGVLRIVDITEDHEDAFRSLRRRSGRFLSRWEPRRSPGDVPGSLVEFQRFLEESHSKRTHRMLCERIRDGRVVGQVGFSMTDAFSFPNAEIAYWIGRPFIRKGYGTRMVDIGLAHAFATIGIERVEANIQPGNEASRCLLRRIGFRMRGYSPEYLEIDGERRDHERWALLEEEWCPGMDRSSSPRTKMVSRRSSGANPPDPPSPPGFDPRSSPDTGRHPSPRRAIRRSEHPEDR